MSKRALKAASIAATGAAKNFGALVDRVRETGATYVIERHGRPIAQIGPVESGKPRTLRNLIEAIEAAPKLDDEVLRYIGSRAISRSKLTIDRPERTVSALRSA